MVAKADIVIRYCVCVYVCMCDRWADQQRRANMLPGSSWTRASLDGLLALWLIGLEVASGRVGVSLGRLNGAG